MNDDFFAYPLTEDQALEQDDPIIALIQIRDGVASPCDFAADWLRKHHR